LILAFIFTFTFIFIFTADFSASALDIITSQAFLPIFLQISPSLYLSIQNAALLQFLS